MKWCALWMALLVSGSVVAGDLDDALTKAAEAKGRRVALLIGNADYGNPAMSLNSPVHDVNAVAKRLDELDFDVIVQVENGTRSEMVQAVKRASKAAAGGTIFFFYSGHAIQVDGMNWLIPVKARVRTLADVQIEAVAVRHILNGFDDARLRIAILDACRNNPFGVGAKSLGQSGLARTRLDGLSGTIVSFSAAPGTVAYDGKPGEMSPYTRALVSHLRTPGLGLNDIFMSVRGDLSEMTAAGPNGPQRSEEVSSLTHRDRFYFSGTVDVGGTKSKPVKLVEAERKPEAPRLLLLELGARKVDARDAQTITDIVGVRLQKASNLNVVTTNDVRRLIAIEAERAALGCEEAADACVAEAADAIGARYSFFGEVSKLGEVFVVTLSIMDARRAKVVARERLQVAKMEEMTQKIDAVVDKMLRTAEFSSLPVVVAKAEPTPSAPEPNTATVPLSLIGAGTVGIVAGLSATLIGTIPIIAANNAATRLQDGGLSAAQQQTLRAEGRRAIEEANGPLAVTLMSAGPVLAVAGGVLLTWGVMTMPSE